MVTGRRTTELGLADPVAGGVDAARGMLGRFAWTCLLSAQLIAAPLGGGAQACAFHHYAPEKTAIDWIIETDHLVVARNTPENQFAYSVVETLRDGGRPVVINQIVDSGTRSRLLANPDEAVLFAHDDVTGEWRSVAYLTPEFRKLVDKVRADIGT